ncbi:MAG: class I SAM-dependent DNA methyltransferase [Pseudomonadota bacterium]
MTHTAALAPDTNEALERYDDWAWLYDQTVGPEYCDPQWRFLQRTVLPRVPAQADLLDLCCGTGQLMVPLAKQGHRLCGIDSSPAMLTCARRHVPQAELLQADARAFELPARFDGVFSTSASLNHIASLDDLGRVFACVFQALRPGGVFAFDLNHPEQLARWWQGQPLEGDIADRFAWLITPRYDAATRQGTFTVTMHRPAESWRPGLTALARRALYRLLHRPRFIGLRLRALQRFEQLEPGWLRTQGDYPVWGHPIDDVRRLLQAAGFQGIRVGTVDGDTPPDDRHSAHFIAIKEQAP